MTGRRFMHLLALVVLTGVAGARADVVVSQLFSDHMVLQRNLPIRVWGTADPDEEVAVRIADRSAKAKADAKRRWEVRLNALKAGGPHEMTITGRNTITIKDVLVGEVWVCSGQSNMAFQVQRAINGEQEVASAGHPQIRLLKVARKPADEPAEFPGKEWQVCSPETVGEFSAVGYFFGRALQKALNVPIGLIDSSVGGTPAESWTPKAALEAEPAFASIFERWKTRIAAAKAAEEKKAAEAAGKEGKGGAAAKPAAAKRAASSPAKRAARPAPTLAGLLSSSQRPAVLWNGMVHPLVPYGIHGVIWYQGEANAGRAYEYRKLFPTMIRSWRQAWGQGDFPFLFVQLASYQSSQKQPYESAWAELREAQLMTLSLPATGMAVATDVGDPKDIHPKNKQEVGRRLALAARATVYGEKIEYSGPMYESMAVEGDHVRIKFNHADGLQAAGGGAIKGFAVAGDDKKFVEAEAIVVGEMIVVRSSGIAHPVAVRYAWADVPDCNLVNKDGLPASPFRTDDWPGITMSEK